eukprot:5211681-Lingulodinium_polyedra.AAC.1
MAVRAKHVGHTRGHCPIARVFALQKREDNARAAVCLAALGVAGFCSNVLRAGAAVHVLLAPCN